jgi:hypothetical protein
VEVEAAKVVPYHRPILRAVQKLQRLCRTTGLYSELSSCDMRCTPAVEEEDYEVMYSIDGIH